MSEPTITLTREELYEKVWTTPMQKLAAEFGYSDRGLAKLCGRHQVPVPPRGYWARLQAGQSGKRTPLPSVTDTSLGAVEIYPHEKRPTDQLAEMEEQEIPIVTVAEDSPFARPFTPRIENTSQGLRKATAACSSRGAGWRSRSRCLRSSFRGHCEYATRSCKRWSRPSIRSRGQNPCCNRSAIHSLSFRSVYRSDRGLRCCAFMISTSICPSRLFHTGFQYTPTDSIATYVTLQARSQSTDLPPSIDLMKFESSSTSHRLRK